MLRLHLDNAHPRDEHIRFQEEGHIYYIHGETGSFVSCTTFIHSFVSEFDADGIIQKMMKSPKWPTSRYYGKSAEEIKQEWEDNRDSAAKAGTSMHLQIELFFNRVDWDTCAQNPGDSVEMKYFFSFVNDVVLARGWKPFRTEWMIYHEEYQICGSIDMIFRDASGRYILVDWKRSKEIKTSNFYQRCRPPISYLHDCNLVHYSLQTTLYSRILREKYDVYVEEIYLVVLHPQHNTYLMVKVDPLEDALGDLIKHRQQVLHGNTCVLSSDNIEMLHAMGQRIMEEQETKISLE